MTAGEHSDRGYGRGEQDYPSHYGPDADEQQPGHPGNPWTEEPSWPPAGGDTGRYDHAPAYDPAYGYGYTDPAGYGSGAYPGAAWYDETASDPYRQPGAASPPAGGYDTDASGAWYRSPADPRAAAGEGGGDGRSGRRSRRGREGRRGLPLWQEVPLLLVIAFCLALLVRTFLVQAFYIPSGSMEETLLAGDRVLVNKIVYDVREPARGEVVVFRGTSAWSPQPTGDSDIGMFSRIGRTLGDLVGVSRPGERDYIKRIVGLPGDRVSCCDVEGRVFVNGQPLDEAYVSFNAPLNDAPEGADDCRSRRFDEVVVESGQMFVMGDHRAISQDSRCQGQVPIENIIGRAFVIVWPSDRWTSLPAPATFDPVPQAGAVRTVPVRPAPGEPALVLPLLLSAAAALRTSRRVPEAAGGPGVVGSRSD